MRLRERERKSEIYREIDRERGERGENKKRGREKESEREIERDRE